MYIDGHEEFINFRLSILPTRTARLERRFLADSADHTTYTDEKLNSSLSPHLSALEKLASFSSTVPNICHFEDIWKWDTERGRWKRWIVPGRVRQLIRPSVKIVKVHKQKRLGLQKLKCRPKTWPIIWPRTTMETDRLRRQKLVEVKKQFKQIKFLRLVDRLYSSKFFKYSIYRYTKKYSTPWRLELPYNACLWWIVYEFQPKLSVTRVTSDAVVLTHICNSHDESVRGPGNNNRDAVCMSDH